MHQYVKSIMPMTAVAVLALVAGHVGAAVTLVRDGKSSAVIVVDDNATSNAKYAARELQTYLEKLSGARLPIGNTPGEGVNLFVGEGAATRAAGLTTEGLKYDGFRIATRGDRAIHLFGRDHTAKEPAVDDKQPYEAGHIYNKKLDICACGEAGTLYAVYHFLRETCGVRWFMPGDLGEVVPEMKTIEVHDIDIARSPDFYYRVIWMGLFDSTDEGSIWYRRAGFGAPFPVNINHTFVLMQKYYPAHPEYFALLKNGERDYNTTCLKEGNLCLSNPALFRQFVDDICAYFDAHPGQKIFSVMPGDGMDAICECAECQAQADYDKPKKGMYSNYVWGFVNRVAKEVAIRHPGKLIGCAAYGTWMPVPDRVKLEPNVAVMVTKAVGFRFWDDYRYRNDVLTLEWATITSNLFTWDYYCWDTTNPHLTGLPILFSQWIADSLKQLKGKSNGTFIEVGTVGTGISYPEMNHLNIYLTGRLLWDADADVQALRDDYYTNFYGPAAPDMKAFWTYAEEVWTGMEVKDRSAKVDLPKVLYTPTVLQKLKSYLEAAQAGVKPESVYGKRIAGIQNHFYTYVDKVSSARSARPTYVVKRTAERPVIDGLKSDAIWLTADVLDFARQTDAKPPMAKTFGRMLHDGEQLYILVEADEPAMDKLVAKAGKNDSTAAPYIWEDDAMEIFIAPEPKNPDSYGQIVINAGGVCLDGWHGSPGHYGRNYEFDWNSKTVFQIGKQPNGWIIEMALPLASLDVDGKIGSEWIMNLCRDRVADVSECSAWSPPLSGNWHTPSRFGFVALEK